MIVWHAATNSASVVDNGIDFCFLEPQPTGQEQNFKIEPVVDFLDSVSLAKSKSENPL